MGELNWERTSKEETNRREARESEVEREQKRGRESESGEKVKEERVARMRDQEVETWKRKQENEAEMHTQPPEVLDFPKGAKNEGFYGEREREKRWVLRVGELRRWVRVELVNGGRFGERGRVGHKGRSLVRRGRRGRRWRW